MLWRPFLELIMKCVLMVQSKFLKKHNWSKNFQNFSKAKTVLLSVKWIAQNHVLSNFSCWVGRSENLIGSSESPWNEDAKIGIGLTCSLNTSREKFQNVFTKKAWIHWCVANCTSIKHLLLKYFSHTLRTKSTRKKVF